MNNWQYAAEVPTMQYRSANTLPREIALFRADDGPVYASNGPSPEVLALRDRLETNKSNLSLGARARTFALPEAGDGICEIVAELDAMSADALTLTLANSAGNRVVMTYNAGARTMSCDRTRSGVVDFSESFPAVTVAPTLERKGLIALRIFVDRSSIEIFGDDGRFVMTNLVFPEAPYTTLSLSADGGKAKVKNLRIYSLKTN